MVYINYICNAFHVHEEDDVYVRMCFPGFKVYKGLINFDYYTKLEGL